MPGTKPRMSFFKAMCTFSTSAGCSGAVSGVLDRAYEHPLDKEEQASGYLAGGVLQKGYQCGMLWGAALAAGAQAHRMYGAGAQAEANSVVAAQRALEQFRSANGHINCHELVDTSWTSKKQMFRYFIKGGPITCMRMFAKYSPEAFDQVDGALAEPVEVPEGPVSCAAMTAKAMGASDFHATMAAGFAGGIGLSGGACGALGAAVWLRAVNLDSDKINYAEFHDHVGPMVEAFLRASDYNFECTEIVGRKFDGLGDHAAHLKSGGCAKIIEALVGVS